MIGAAQGESDDAPLPLVAAVTFIPISSRRCVSHCASAATVCGLSICMSTYLDLGGSCKVN